VAYKVLGVVALIVAVLMALVSVLVLVTLFANFGVGLLVLFLIVGALTWLFFSVGWQLARPPKGKGPTAGPRAPADEESAPAVSPAAEAAESALPARGPLEARVPPEGAGSFHGFEDQGVDRGGR
jgi:hypothetical protein